MFTFQVDAESMGILSMLQQEPGAAIRLLACRAGIGGRLLLTCCDREGEIMLREFLLNDPLHISNISQTVCFTFPYKSTKI